MGMLALTEFLSVDGVMQGYGSPQEDTDGGFSHGGWGAPYAEALGELVDPADFTGISSYLFGRRTYEKMAEFWPHQPDDNPMAAHLNSTPRYVASRTLTSPTWAGTRVLSDVPAQVRALKEQEPGTVAVLGSGVLARQLLAEDLVDELTLIIHPLLLGTGQRLFGDLPAPRRLELVSLAQSSRGSVLLVYRLVD